MKRIKEYKNLFGVEKEIELKALKNTYRSLVKEWHPDKFQEGDPMREEAEVKSRQIIDGYHFLISIAPETKEANLEEYTETVTNAGIADFNHKGMLLTIDFTDGSTYEDRKSTRLNSSHVRISYAVFCLKKKTIAHYSTTPLFS